MAAWHSPCGLHMHAMLMWSCLGRPSWVFPVMRGIGLMWMVQWPVGAMSACGWTGLCVKVVLCFRGSSLLLTHCVWRLGSRPCLMRGGRSLSTASVEHLAGGECMLLVFHSSMRVGLLIPLTGSHVSAQWTRRGLLGGGPSCVWCFVHAGQVQMGNEE